MKIAIIGTGISGLSSGYLLAPHHDITVYEKNGYIGGHSRTIDIKVNDRTIAVDTGFIVFNDWNYPNLLGLFNHLNVPYVNSDMSFGVSIDKGWLEYSSNDLFALRNITRLSYWGMQRDIIKFNKRSLAYVDKNPTITLGQCIDALKMGEWFKNYYLLAMGAAIWSCSLETMLSFPAQTFLQFFNNHGLLSINNRPQWHTVAGGSKEYITRLIQSFSQQIKLNCGVKTVTSQGEKVAIVDIQGKRQLYDNVIFGCHADEAVKMMVNPTQEQLDIIGSFRYQENKIIVHSDTNLLPIHQKCWASWVYLSAAKKDTKPVVSLSYWMNNLQPLAVDTPIIITLNPTHRPQQHLIYDEHIFSHPVFDFNALKAQQRLDAVQGKNGLWFCGAYQRYGFHEDGLLSSINIAKKMGVKIPWQ